LSNAEEIAEVYYGEIQGKTNQVLSKSGILPFLSDSETFNPSNPKTLDGFHIERLYKQILNSDDTGLLERLYRKIIEEEQRGGGSI